MFWGVGMVLMFRMCVLYGLKIDLGGLRRTLARNGNRLGALNR